MEAVSPPFAPLRESNMGGGGVDVEETAFCCAAVHGVFHHGIAATYHKSVLTARSAPERSTVN